MRFISQQKSPPLADFFLAFLFFLPLIGWSQTAFLSGRVYDAETKQPLSFARVWLAANQKGIYTDLDGRFQLAVNILPDTLSFLFIGYEKNQIIVQNAENNLKIYLIPKESRTEEIVILPEINPAERVMRQAIQNRKQNDFEELPAWRYDSYNKVAIFPITLTPDRSNSEKERKEQDEIVHEIDSLAEKMHLLLWESITHKEFKKPNKSKEEILASKTSGFSTAILPLVPADIVDFSSFYKDWVQVLGQSFMSPLNPESLEKYSFRMKDTLSDELDTIFTIAFEPRKKSFNGFEGILHIHTGRYALQHIRANLLVQEQDQLISDGRVEQLFELQQDSLWFPSQLLTEFEVGTGAMAQNLSGLLRLRMAARVYLKNISLAAEAAPKRFGNEVIFTNEAAAKQDETFWNQYRIDTLDTREKNTYQFIDSLGKKIRFDRWAYQGQKLSSGMLSWRFLDFDLGRIVQYNLVEKLRLGIGAETNETVSRVFSVGAWAGWSWADQTLKYGSFLRVHPFRNKLWQAEYRYEYDLVESGAPSLLMNSYQRTADLLGRNIRLRIMEFQTSRKWILRGPIWNNWTQSLSFSQIDVLPVDGYLYQGLEKYFLNEGSWEHRFAPGEKFLRNGPFRMSLGTTLPVFRVRLFASREWPDGLGLSYSGMSVSVVHTLNLHTRGKFQYALQGNYSEGALPYSRLQVIRGNWDYSWPLSSPMSFNTMRYNEFVADQSVQIHLRYDFNNLLFHSRKWHPNFLVEYNASYGLMKTNSIWHQSARMIQAPDKLFQEAGIIMQDLLPRDWIRKTPTLALIGVAFYYRIGAYTLSEPIDNFSFKLYSGFKF